MSCWARLVAHLPPYSASKSSSWRRSFLETRVSLAAPAVRSPRIPPQICQRMPEGTSLPTPAPLGRVTEVKHMNISRKKVYMQVC